MTETATWNNLRDDFAFDGALVDLIVPGTGANEWEEFWMALLSGPFKLSGRRDGEPYVLPATASEVFAERQVSAITVSVLADPIIANCHFFGGELELDIDPREVTSDTAFESVLSVMRFVSSSVHLPIFAVAEGSNWGYSFLRVLPDGQAEFLPMSQRKSA